MTTSIVFDASLTCDNIESDTTLDPTQTDMLTDPTAPRDALQGLRYLKTRETGNDIVTPNIVGRSTGQSIPYTGNQDPSYFEYKMRYFLYYSHHKHSFSLTHLQRPVL